MKVGIKYQNMN